MEFQEERHENTPTILGKVRESYFEKSVSISFYIAFVYLENSLTLYIPLFFQHVHFLANNYKT